MKTLSANPAVNLSGLSDPPTGSLIVPVALVTLLDRTKDGTLWWMRRGWRNLARIPDLLAASLCISEKRAWVKLSGCREWATNNLLGKRLKKKKKKDMSLKRTQNRTLWYTRTL